MTKIFNEFLNNPANYKNSLFYNVIDLLNEAVTTYPKEFFSIEEYLLEVKRIIGKDKFNSFDIKEYLTKILKSDDDHDWIFDSLNGLLESMDLVKLDLGNETDSDILVKYVKDKSGI